MFRGDPAVAARLFTQYPDVAAIDLPMAVAAGRLDDVRRRLAGDPAAALRADGPMGWPPLLYLAYLRLPADATAALDIARTLLDADADPNAYWTDDWGNRFTALCGVIGLGEGMKPPHPHAAALAELLLDRGAEPYDVQAFYNTSIATDDPQWLEVLWKHAERRGLTDAWREVPERPTGGVLPVNALDFMLSLAVSYSHLRRAAWLLGRGANASGRHAYSRRLLREEALVHGREDMVELLDRMGAVEAPLEPRIAFQVACRTLNRAEAAELASRHAACLTDPEPLLTAARQGRLDIVRLLVELGMPVDLEDASGMRAIHQAAAAGAVDLLRFLVERGADVDRPTTHYGGALGFAAHFGRLDAAAFLAPHSRDVHNLAFLALADRLHELLSEDPALVNRVHPRSGVTPLFTLPPDEDAALEMARVLVARGASVRHRSPAGETAADVARRRGFARVATLLDR